MSDQEQTFRGRVTRQSEEAIGRFAQDLMDSSFVSGALAKAFHTRERAMRAQEAAMGALNLPSAADLERLTRRVRSVSQRLEGIEEGLDRLDERLAQRAAGPSGVEERLTRIEAVLERLESERAAPAQPAASRSRAAKAEATKAATKTAATKAAASRGAAAKPAADEQAAPKRAARTRRPPAAS